MNRPNENRTVKLRVSPRIAALVAREAPRESQLLAARGEAGIEGRDLLTALLFLCHGSDVEIRGAALRTMKEFPAAQLGTALEDAELPEPLRDFILKVRPDLAAPASAPADPEPEAGEDHPQAEEEPQPKPAEAAPPTVRTAEDGDEETGDEEEVNASKYQMSLEMGVADRIKMALTGDKEWRTILVKDANKLVHSAVLKNPRVTDGEVLALAKNKSTGEELIRLITLNKEWLKSYEVQKALAIHPRTPLPKALRFLNNLGDKDLKKLASSRDVSPVLVNAARRMLLAKEKKK